MPFWSSPAAGETRRTLRRPCAEEPAARGEYSASPPRSLGREWSGTRHTPGGDFDLLRHELTCSATSHTGNESATRNITVSNSIAGPSSFPDRSPPYRSRTDPGLIMGTPGRSGGWRPRSARPSAFGPICASRGSARSSRPRPSSRRIPAQEAGRLAGRPLGASPAMGDPSGASALAVPATILSEASCRRFTAGGRARWGGSAGHGHTTPSFVLALPPQSEG